MKILIVDDDGDILSIYKTFLKSNDKEVTLTTNGRKCVEEYKRKLEKININQQEKDITEKMSEIMSVFQNQV